MNQKITVVGAGKMATAISLGLVAKGYAHDEIHAYDVSPDAAWNYRETTGCTVHATMADALAGTDIVLLAVKPQYAPAALAEAKSLIAGRLVISIVAGMKLDTLKNLSGCSRIVRVMPNTPALVRQGMSCFAVSSDVSAADKELAESILSSFGLVREVPESLMDAVTGLSGSGPAYVIEFILGLAEGGVYCGLPRDLALQSAIQTVLGTALMCKQNPASVEALRNAVITPNGTTARGIHVLDQAGFRGTLENCVIAAAERSAELGKK